MATVEFYIFQSAVGEIHFFKQRTIRQVDFRHIIFGSADRNERLTARQVDFTAQISLSKNKFQTPVFIFHLRAPFV